MPRRAILTERQRGALFDLPTDDASLHRYYTLDDDDLEHIARRRRAVRELVAEASGIAGVHGTEYRKRWENGVDGGDELEARQGARSSAHRKLEKNTELTTGTESRRGTRLSSIPIVEHFRTPRGPAAAAVADDTGPDAASVFKVVGIS